MKRNKTISLALAFCLGMGVLWYGGVGILKNTRKIKLEDEEGDRAAALSGITFEGFSEEQAFRYNFRLRNGKMKSSFDVCEYEFVEESDESYMYSIYVPDPQAELTLEKQEEEGVWSIGADRMRILADIAGKGKKAVRFDSGLTVQGMPGEYQFQGYSWDGQVNDIYMGRTDPFDWMCFNQGIQSAIAEVNGQTVAALNLPWGGTRLYQVEEWTEESLDRQPAQLDEADLANQIHGWAQKETEPIGSVKLLKEWPSTEATRVIAIYPMEDKMVLISQTDASRPCYQLDEEGWVVKAERPAESWVNAILCDAQGNVIQTVSLMRLSDMYSYLTHALRMSRQDGEVSFVLEAVDNKQQKTHLQKGVVLRMEEGEIKAILSPTFAGTPEGEALGLAQRPEHPRLIANVKADLSGERLAVIWQDYVKVNQEYTKLEGGDLKLQVFEKDEPIYTGTLKCGWENQERSLLVGGWDYNIGRYDLPEEFIGFDYDDDLYFLERIYYPGALYQDRVFYE